MIKSIITAVAVAATSLVAVPEAQAMECFRNVGYTLCFELVSKNGVYSTWNVQVTNSYTTEDLVVTCYGKEMDHWRSTGGATQAQAEKMAEDFCAI